jgi:hypothetical protein
VPAVLQRKRQIYGERRTRRTLEVYIHIMIIIHIGTRVSVTYNGGCLRAEKSIFEYRRDGGHPRRGRRDFIYILYIIRTYRRISTTRVVTILLYYCDDYFIIILLYNSGTR